MLEEIIDDLGRGPDSTDASAGSAACGSVREFIGAATIGKLVAIADNGARALVMFPGQSGAAAIPARTVVDVHGGHVGADVVLMFEDGAASCPIIMGVLRTGRERSLPEKPGNVEVQADGERLLVTASEQLVLRCGSASITLTKAGKVLIQGTYISQRSSGVLRVKGGAVHLN